MNKYIKDLQGIYNNGLLKPTNTPTQYKDRQKQYMADRSARFIEKRAKIATDYVTAQVQGLTSDFYEWQYKNIRFADVATSNPVSFNGIKYDDAKNILFDDSSINYFPVGALLETMGSTWLCINPSNMSSAYTNAAVVRCNAVYNSYDEYGNIISEPIVVKQNMMNDNDRDNVQKLNLQFGYFHITCQLNENTRQIAENKRIMLGSNAYYITGVMDFLQEFTEEDNCHIMTFTARIDEVTANDDVINKIAEGNTYSFNSQINGSNSAFIGKTDKLIPLFIRNGDIVSDMPLTWTWTSSDEDILTVDNGTITGVSDGIATVTATLEENPNIQSSIEITVEADTPYIQFDVFDNEMKQFETQTISAYYYVNGEKTADVVEWNTEGTNYNAETNGNECTVQALGDGNVTLTATYNGYSATTEITFEAY